jgi:DNA-binding transcriptional regulator YiaG
MLSLLLMNVKQLRKRLGLTSQELAVKLGVSVATVSRWETGRHKPSKLALLRLRELQAGSTGVE